MKEKLKKIGGWIKKPFSWINRKTKPAREFMRKGRAGAMIMEVALSVYLWTWAMDGTVYHQYPKIVMALVLTALLVITSELLNLIIKLLFGGGKRHKTYFFVALFAACMNNIAATQFNAVPIALLMNVALLFAVNILGRVIWGFIRTRKFKQVTAYIALTLSIAYIALYGYMFFNDNFGDSRVEFYNNIYTESAEQVQGFDTYLTNGAYTVNTLSYGPDDEDITTATYDLTIFDELGEREGMDAFLDNFSTYEYDKAPIKGQIWYPEGQTNCPVLFFVHGNHDSMVPSYLGYDYLGEYLASNGYVVVSVDENIINQCGAGNDMRAVMLLENMKTIFALNEDSTSPIHNLINEDQVAIGGHSRGGEMVATAYLFNDMDVYPEDGNIAFDYHFNITSIVAIAPCVDQYMPVNHSVEIENVNYLLIHGSNDQDVSDDMGEKQYNNISFTDDGFYLKSSVYILGANHGQFNSQWGQYDYEGTENNYLNTYNFISSDEQKTIALAYIRTFLDTTLGIDNTYESLLEDNSAYLSYLPDTVYITNYEDSDFVSLVDFDGTSNISSFENIVTVNCNDTTNWTFDRYDRGSGNEAENYVLSLGWDEGTSPEAVITFDNIDITDGYVSFAIADMREDTEELQEGVNYTVTLTDANGNEVSIANPTFIYHSLAVQLYRQDVIAGTYEYKHQLQTVRIFASDFENQNTFDFTAVTSITIAIDGTEEGSLIIDNIGYGV